MNTSQDKIKIASDACVLLGASVIQSFDENTTEAQTARSFYDDVYMMALSSSNWSFAKMPVELNRLDEKPDYGYKYVYNVKADIIRIISLNDRPNQDYRLVKGRELHTSIENPYVVALVKVDESQLPHDFIFALKHKLAAAFCSTITDDTAQLQRFEAKADQLMKRAQYNDQIQQPANYLKDSILISAHRGSR